MGGLCSAQQTFALCVRVVLECAGFVRDWRLWESSQPSRALEDLPPLPNRNGSHPGLLVELDGAISWKLVSNLSIRQW